MPERIQLRRTKGWRIPDDTIVVARPSRWGNWYAVRQARQVWPAYADSLVAPAAWVVVTINKWGHVDLGRVFGGFEGCDGRRQATQFAVDMHRHALAGSYLGLDGPMHRRHYLDPLRGHNLGCWCPLDGPCHADTLLDLANREVA